MCQKSVVGFACTTCSRPTNHSIISIRDDFPDFDYAKLKCLACSNTFGVKYPKGGAPSSSSEKIVFPTDNDSEYPTSLYVKD